MDSDRYGSDGPASGQVRGDPNPKQALDDLLKPIDIDDILAECEGQRQQPNVLYPTDSTAGEPGDLGDVTDEWEWESQEPDGLYCYGDEDDQIDEVAYKCEWEGLVADDLYFDDVEHDENVGQTVLEWEWEGEEADDQYYDDDLDGELDDIIDEWYGLDAWNYYHGDGDSDGW